MTSKRSVVVTRWFDKKRNRPLYEVKPCKGKFEDTVLDTDTLDDIHKLAPVESAHWGATELLIFSQTSKTALKNFEIEVLTFLKNVFDVTDVRIANDMWRGNRP